MKIARQKNAKEIKISDTMTVWEYPVLSDMLHGAVVKLTGRYPMQGRVVNEICLEIGYVIEGSGTLVVEGKEIAFNAGDQLFINKGERYFWDAQACIFMPCTPAWYPAQHKEVA